MTRADDISAPPPEGVPAASPEERATWPRTDLGNAKRLASANRGEMLHVRGQGWRVWDGSHFPAERGPVLARRRAAKLSELVREEAAAMARRGPTPADEAEAKRRLAEDDKQASIAEFARGTIQAEAKTLVARRVAAHRKHANTCESKGKISAALDLAEAMEGVALEPDEVNAHPLVFNARNCRLDLARWPDGEAVDLEEAAAAIAGPHRAEDRITFLGGAAFDPEAECPRFMEFLARIQPDPAMRAFLQRAFGYCLTGSVAEQMCFLFQGEGANGKSTLLSVIARVLGSYAGSIPIASFLRTQSAGGSGPSPDIARLPGLRMVRASEPKTGDKIDEGKLKAITGGEPISARKLQEDFIDFLPQFKVFLSFNRAPVIPADDDGTWRRMAVVPFPVQIPKAERRPMGAIMAEFEAELSGILNWCLAGVALWRADGLPWPEPVENASRELREGNDMFGQFLADCCVRDDRAECLTKAIRAVAEGWWEDQTGKKITPQALGRRLGERGFRGTTVGAASDKARRGLRLKLPNEDGRPAKMATWLRELGLDDNGGLP